MSAKVEPKNFDGTGIFTAISLRGRTSLNSEGATRNFSTLHRIHWVQRPPPQYDPRPLRDLCSFPWSNPIKFWNVLSQGGAGRLPVRAELLPDWNFFWSNPELVVFSIGFLLGCCRQSITATGSLGDGLSGQVWSTPPQYLGKSLDPAYLHPVLGLCFFHSEQQQPYQNSMHVLWAVDHKTPPPCRGLC